MDHRWGHRVDLHLPVQLRGAASGGDGVLRNASISGAYIETAADLPVCSNLEVTVIAGSGAAKLAVDLQACVRRVEAGGVGVEWRDMACGALVALLRGKGAEAAQLTARDQAFHRSAVPHP